MSDGRQGEQGQDRELFPILPLIGEVLHSSTPPTPKSSNQKKETHRQRAKKSGLERGWGGRFKKKNDGQTGGGGFVANHVPLFPLFPAHPLPFDKNNVLPWIFSLGANSKMGTIAGTRVLCTQYPARVTKGY